MIAGDASLLSPTPLDAAASLTGNLTGSIDSTASLTVLDPIDATGVLAGGLSGSLAGAASLGSTVTPINATASTHRQPDRLDQRCTASLGTLPLTLSDFDDTGLDVEFAAVITAVSAETLYSDTNRGGTSTVDDGDLAVGDLDTVSHSHPNFRQRFPASTSTTTT